jgi:hypothetical protein
VYSKAEIVDYLCFHLLFVDWMLRTANRELKRAKKWKDWKSKCPDCRAMASDMIREGLDVDSGDGIVVETKDSIAVQ